MKRETKLLILLFIIAFIIRSIFVFSTPMQIWDETVYANLGYDLSNNLLDYSVANNGWSDFIPSGGDNFYAWPKMGFRAPLLPYLLMPLYLFHLNFLVIFFIAIIGAFSVCLVYLLGKKLFNEKVALYSAILFLLIPLHIIYSAKILTGVLFTFFVLLTFFSFWKGYEENNKKHKVLFGIFLALALLSRYTALWIMPIFLLYFLARDKSLKFLKDKYLWYSILAFFGTLIPWFIYGIFEYNNPIGAFIHGAKASAYWGGLQSWHFFFDYWWQMFSIIGIIFVIALIYILYKKEFFKKEVYLLLIWFAFFLGMAIYMPHKEDRFILAIVPTIALISGYFIDKIKKYKKLILIGIILITLFSLSSQFYATYNNSYTDTNKCFLEGNKFLENAGENSVIITDESSVVYYYTKKETRFYPNPWSYETLKNWIKSSYSDKEVYVLFGDYIIKPEEEYNQIKEDLESNSEKVFECSKESGYSAIYKISA
ncbi:phospholipid carrier-dependent glycosyltransferase [Candidatus Woesearchaeota archaeon]|jgi:4-amino-4-deoxy-L-arabinose transferase-like glycosyltransferase|nr:phospholipid carrier-dependent glycosyltransferase [Candidatus Woesearchaeota archaeon]